AYFPGIGAFDDLGELRMADTNLILLEMPFERWSVPTIRETIQISSRTGLTPVLAHVERFLRYNPISSLVRLAEGGCLIQCNAELFLENGSLARKILKHLDVEFIGSDAHGSFSRAPNIGQAESRIRKSFPQFWTHLEHTSERLCLFLDT
ncbi:MAG: hypothetical protein II797_02625, partial [Clostridia bacterium]|nr:hypothetical protein [Clostridia bacterium]